MTLAKDKSENVVCSTLKDMLHYLHPDYVDDKSVEIYSNSRCPLSMLAETCNNIGKVTSDNPSSQSQDSNLPKSPSCSSSCSAPKFSPRSFDFSPIDHLKSSEDHLKDRFNKDKSKKRKANKKDFQEVSEKRMTSEHSGLLNSSYTISEFLKMNNFPLNNSGKQDPNNFIHPFYNQLLNSNFNQNMQSSPLWKSKQTHHHPRMPFPVGFQNNNFPINPNIPHHMFRPPQPNILNELNHFYNNSQIEKSFCDCVVCCHKRHMEKNMIKVDPVLFNSLNCLRLPRPQTNNIISNLMPSMGHIGSAGNGSTIKYCMYCGNYIPQIQNLLNHIHSEHVDQISSNFQPKLDSPGSLNLMMGNQQSKEMKSREILKQLHLLYNNEHTEDLCGEKSLLMR